MATVPLSADAENVLDHLHRTRSPVQHTKTAVKSACHLTDPQRLDATLKELFNRKYMLELSDGALELTREGIAAAKERRDSKSKKSSTTVIQNFDKVENSRITTTGILKTALTTGKDKAPAKETTRDSASHEIMSTPTSFHALTGIGSQPVSPFDEKIDMNAQTLPESENPIPSFRHHPLRFTGQILGVNERNKQATEFGVRFTLTFEDHPDALPIPLIDKDILGRSRHTDIWIRHDNYISQQHCRFTIKKVKSGYELFVEDLASRNGTRVGEKILQAYTVTPLKHGDRLRVGKTTLIISLLAE
jgi:pSer/pThr/pTyr-binding forkhead associated (FHA) protein